MLVLGLNAYHADSAAAIFADGRLIAAAEEERFTRVKHWAGFPAQAVRFCLEECSADLSSVDAVAVNSDRTAALLRKLIYLSSGRARANLVLEKLTVRSKRSSIAEELTRVGKGKFKGRIVHVEHHHAHLASAFLVSPFEEAAVVSVDGFGDFSSSAWGRGTNDRVSIHRRVHFPHSLGVFYQALTQYLGFPQYGDEYKVMGLASYGRPRYLDKLASVLVTEENGDFELGLKFFEHHRNKAGFRWDGTEPVMDDLFSSDLEELLGQRREPKSPVLDRHEDIASSVQSAFEEALFNMLNAAQAHVDSKNLALAGGCAMNSVANGKIRKNTGFRQIYVQPSAGDAGGAIGAALVASTKLGSNGRRTSMTHAYWGSSFDNEQILARIESKRAELDAEGCSFELLSSSEELLGKTVSALIEGRVAGWFGGRMEWGPRALGNRSILCDPRRSDMKEIMNEKIKRRESFRPFAPSILREKVNEWFETDEEVPFMCRVFEVKREVRDKIPAVTHVDGTGRLQTVRREQNSRYYDLIELFFSRTGVPILLNTSFNENEPIVRTPDEALDCFLRTKMDILIIGDYFVYRVD